MGEVVEASVYFEANVAITTSLSNIASQRQPRKPASASENQPCWEIYLTANGFIPMMLRATPASHES
jgi:hypothetical protein